MEEYRVKPFPKGKDIVVEVPGSKSITNRALLMAALSSGKVLLKGALFSDDSRYFLKALQDLGFEVEVNEAEKTVVVLGTDGILPKQDVEIYVGSAGTAARFLTAMLGLSGGVYTIQASEQMKKRPMRPLFEALEQLGVEFQYLEEPYYLPVRVLGRTETTNHVELDISKTSQPLSALLMTSVMLKEGLQIQINSEKKTGSYIDITRKMMKEFGCDTMFDGVCYQVLAHSSFSISEYQIEPDVSAACYFYALAAITNGSCVVKYVHEDTMQGDIQFLEVLRQMGCQTTETTDGIKLISNGILKGNLDVDMNNFSDQALTLAAISVFADGPVQIRNISHIRLQECDRLRAMKVNLDALGIQSEESEDGILIYPKKTTFANIETFEDHRVAMAFTLVGLVNEGVTILNPMCCRKTFENYFSLLDSLYDV